ncbi:MAG: hypothetical protein K9J25_06645 [Bacteroidales bacterium]|nr:hypothetical protein [Bacteroidales bacterium]
MVVKNSIGNSGVIIIEGHVQGLANMRSLASKGVEVYVVATSDCIARYSKYCSKFFRCPEYISDVFVGFLIDLAEKENIRGWCLLPSNDHAVYNISKNREKLCQYYKVITPGLNIIENIYNKISLIKLANECDVPVPWTLNGQFLKLNNNKKFEYPLILKGIFGLSFYKTVGKKAILINSLKELNTLINSFNKSGTCSDYYVQELIPFSGRNYTVSFTSFSIDGEIKSFWMGVKVREHPARFGTATFAESIFSNECLLLSKRLLKKIDYTGVCEIEYIFDERIKQYKLIEINARTWLWVDLAIQSGIDFPMYIYNYLNNIEQTYTTDYKLGNKWRNIITDTGFAILNIFKGKINLKTYIKQNRGIIYDTLLCKTDIKPFFAYLFFLFNFWRKR